MRFFEKLVGGGLLFWATLYVGDIHNIRNTINSHMHVLYMPRRPIGFSSDSPYWRR